VNLTKSLVPALALATASLVPAAFAQRGGPDWTTSAGDPQRTAWVRFDPQVTPAKIVKPDAFKFLWKVKMAGTAGKPSQPILISTYIGFRGFKALTVVGGPDYIYTVDYDLGLPYWDQHYKSTASAPACAVWPSAIGKLSPLTPNAPRTARPSAGYHTVTGKPHEGIPLEAAMGGQLGAGGPGRVAAPAQALPPGIRFSVPIFTVTSDGMAHAITFDSGKEAFKPVAFLPPGSAPSDLIVVQNTLYAATMPGCGSHPNSVYALDVSNPEMKPLGAWQAPSGNVLGAPAFNKDGVLFVTTDKAMYALKPMALEGTAVTEASFASTPVVITGKANEWVAAATKDGKILLMNGNGAASTAVSTAAGFTPTALATFDDASGMHWLLATDTTKSTGAVHAFKLTESGSEPSLQEVWKSADLVSPGRPIIVDGVVFALATGADRNGGSMKPPVQGTHATIYALDAATGKPLWDSGSTITSYVNTGGLAFNESELFLPTADDTLYTFGHPEPHQ
jgi:outer membrane protein assembly factor BamB